MKRGIIFLLILGLTLGLFPVSVGAYLLSPHYVLERMVQSYASLQALTVTQRVEAYGEDTVIPFASLDEKVQMIPFSPLKIWIGDTPVSDANDLPPELGVNRFLIEAQHQYGFFKDVFLIHEVNLLKGLLQKLGVASLQEKLSLLYPNIAYWIGDDTAAAFPAGLWIDKDRFIPLRLAGTLSGQQNGAPFTENVEIQYGDYRLLKGKIWYPFDIKFFVNGALSLRIQASNVTLTLL